MTLPAQGDAKTRIGAMQYDLFISHSSADADAAFALVNEIESHGILKCWIAPRDIPIGASYQREIVRAIANCGGFVLLFSRKTNESDHVLREIELAEQGRKAIYPIKIDGSEPAEGIKYFLANKQWVERKALGNRLVDTIEQMVANARRMEGGIEQPRPAPEPPKKKASISPMLIGAAAIVLLLLAGGVGAWQGDWFGIGAAKRERLAKEDQARKEEERRQEELRKQALAQKEKEEQEKRLAQQKEEEEKEKARVKKEEEEKEKQRLASIQPINLPTGTTGDITILKSAPTVGDAVPGKTFFRECDICPVMAVVAAGSNLIGSPNYENGRSNNEGPQQGVVFRVPLAVGRSEISFDEYIACVNEGGCPPGIPSDSEWGYGKQPAINVSWNDAKAYVGWLSRKTRATYRLLSEAEWEYAARGCAKVCESLPFWFGIEISKDRVNYDSRIAYLGSPKATRRNRTVPVDAAEANPFGLLHVHGNVAEWVEDCWQETLEGMPRDGLARTGGDCSRRVIRGGSYSDEPKDVRSAKRSWQAATDRRSQIGFRVARELKL
jgi:formylglycine-generating enzyme required for sulfatase activity